MELQLNKEIVGDILPTKSNIEKISTDLIADIKNGWVDPFETLAKLEAIKAMCDQVRTGVEDHVRTELEKYGKEGHKSLDASFALAEVGVKYDYSNDPVWADWNKQLEAVKEQMKESEKFLKALSKPLAETNLESGEVIERIPPTKTSKSSFKITLGK